MKTLWDFNVYTDKKKQARRLDIIVLAKANTKAGIIDAAVPADLTGVDEKEKEKISKYQDLRIGIEIERLWKVKTCTILM